MKKAVIVTGSNGGIGAAIKTKFASEGYAVIGIGKSADQQSCDEYIQVDFNELAKNAALQSTFYQNIQIILARYKLKGLINNSAVQIISRMNDLSVSDFQKTLNVNLVAPFILSKLCVELLAAGRGSILNIGSIHAKLTKPQFVAYATSKGALETMTKAMAVDIGSMVRVNMIAPAAIETEMLKDGFSDSAEGYAELVQYHPTQCIGRTDEVALLAYRIIEDDINFLNGAVIELTGGIAGRLHDPS